MYRRDRGRSAQDTDQMTKHIGGSTSSSSRPALQLMTSQIAWSLGRWKCKHNGRSIAQIGDVVCGRRMSAHGPVHTIIIVVLCLCLCLLLSLCLSVNNNLNCRRYYGCCQSGYRVLYGHSDHQHIRILRPCPGRSCCCCCTNHYRLLALNVCRSRRNIDCLPLTGPCRSSVLFIC